MYVQCPVSVCRIIYHLNVRNISNAEWVRQHAPGTKWDEIPQHVCPRCYLRQKLLSFLAGYGLSGHPGSTALPR